jgi:hypothetical protein
VATEREIAGNWRGGWEDWRMCAADVNPRWGTGERGVREEGRVGSVEEAMVDRAGDRSSGRVMGLSHVRCDRPGASIASVTPSGSCLV